MVEADDSAGDVSARGVIVGTDEGAYAGIGTEDPGAHEGGGELGAFGDEKVHFVRGYGHVVALLERNAGRCGADDAYGVSGDEDIGIGGLAAAVYHHIVDTVGEDEEGAFCREHAHVHSGHFGYLVAPDAGGVHCDGSIEVLLLSGLDVAGVYAFDGVAFADEAGNFGVEPYLAAMNLCIEHVGGAEAEGVHAAVRHPHGTYQAGIYGGFKALGFFGVDDIGPDSGLAAGLYEGGLVGEVVFREGYEKTVGLIYAVGGYTPQYHVFAYAFLCAFCIVYGVAGAGMQQAVVPSGCAGRDVALFNEKGSEPPHGAVSLGAGAGDATADDDYVKLVWLHG